MLLLFKNIKYLYIFIGSIQLVSRKSYEHASDGDILCKFQFFALASFKSKRDEFSNDYNFPSRLCCCVICQFTPVVTISTNLEKPMTNYNGVELRNHVELGIWQIYLFVKFGINLGVDYQSLQSLQRNIYSVQTICTCYISYIEGLHSNIRNMASKQSS